MDRVTPDQARKGSRAPLGSFPDCGFLALTPWDWSEQRGTRSLFGGPYSYPTLPHPQSQAMSLLPPSQSRASWPAAWYPYCSQRAPLPAPLLFWPSRWLQLPSHPNLRGWGEALRMRKRMGGGFLPQAGEQGLLKWLQQALWCLKDSRKGGEQRLGGSLHGGCRRSWGWG